MRGKCKGSSLLNAALTVWLAAMFATARPHTDYAIAEGEQHNFQASKEQAIQHHEYLHAKSLVKGRMRERIEATKHQRSRWLAASVQCILRNETTDEEAQRVLSWLCDADGAGHSCHGIKEGGSHHHPVHPKDHLEWTMTSLHEMHEGKNNHGHSTCWFGGIAYLVPPPVNELFLELPSGSDSIAPGAMLLLRSEGDTIEGRLVRSGGENMSLCRDVQVLKAGESIAFEAKNYHAVADRMRKKATFEIHVRGDVMGAVLLAELAFDFDGDGKFDRIETFREHVVRTDLNGSVYQWQRRGNVLGDPAFRDLKNGSVRLQLSNVGSEECYLHRFTERSPSHLRIPYFPY